MCTIFYTKDGISYQQTSAYPVCNGKRIKLDDSYFYELYFEVVRLDSNEPIQQ